MPICTPARFVYNPSPVTLPDIFPSSLYTKPGKMICPNISKYSFTTNPLGSDLPITCPVALRTEPSLPTFPKNLASLPIATP